MGNASELHEDALESAFNAFGIDVTILAAGPNPTEKTVSGIWVQPNTQTDLDGLGVQSVRPSRVLALRRAEIPGRVRRGLKLRCADGPGGPVRDFRIDGQVEIFDDHFRVQLVPES